MSASIVLSGLTWSAPDTTPVLDGIDLTFTRERTGLVGRNGVGKTTLLRLIAGELQPRDGRVVMTGTAAKLRQIVATGTDETIADLFGAAHALAVIDRADQGLAEADELADVDWALPARMEAALTSVGLSAAATVRLETLSGGQRTRAALAAAIFAAPDFLLLDEPTNHLDRAGRDAMMEVLTNWRGGAIIVSHDRALLEHMDAIVELTSLGARRYGGNWSAYRERKTIELEAAEHQLAVVERHAEDIARKTQLSTERKQRRDAVGARKGASGSMPRIVAGMRRERAEGSGGEAKRLAERQREEASQALLRAKGNIEILEGMNIVMPATRLPAEKTVLVFDHVTAGYGAIPVLVDVSLTIIGPERVAVTGTNGSGKSTLLALASGALAPWSGAVHRHVRCAMLDQDIGILDQGTTVAENFARLNPAADENACRAALARFRFRADAALRFVATLSGGQALRAGLACVLGAGEPPQLLLLDEPTNHLDLESLAAIEEGLNAYDGALLVTSHDEAFLTAIGITQRVELA